jgi:hypothetical protein
MRTFFPVVPHVTLLSQQDPSSGSQCSPTEQQTGPGGLSWEQTRSPEQQVPPTQVSSSKQFSLVLQLRSALTHVFGLFGCVRAQT